MADENYLDPGHERRQRDDEARAKREERLAEQARQAEQDRREAEFEARRDAQREAQQAKQARYQKQLAERKARDEAARKKLQQRREDRREQQKERRQDQREAAEERAEQRKQAREKRLASKWLQQEPEREEPGKERGEKEPSKQPEQKQSQQSQQNTQMPEWGDAPKLEPRADGKRRHGKEFSYTLGKPDPNYRGPTTLVTQHGASGMWDVTPDGRFVMTSWREMAERSAELGAPAETIMTIAGWDSNYNGVDGEKVQWYKALLRDYNIEQAIDKEGKLKEDYKGWHENLMAQAGEVPEWQQAQEQKAEQAQEKAAQKTEQKTEAREAAQQEKAEAKQEQAEAREAQDKAEEKTEAQEKEGAQEQLPPSKAREQGADRAQDQADQSQAKPSVLAEKLMAKVTESNTPVEPIPHPQQPRPDWNRMPGGRPKPEPKLPTQEGPKNEPNWKKQQDFVEPKQPQIDLKARAAEARGDGRWKEQVFSEGHWVEAKEHKDYRLKMSQSALTPADAPAVKEQGDNVPTEKRLKEGSAWLDYDKGVSIDKGQEWRYGDETMQAGRTVEVARPTRTVILENGEREDQTFLAERKEWVRATDHKKATQDYLAEHTKEQPELSAEEKRERGMGKAWTRSTAITPEGKEEQVWVSRSNGEYSIKPRDPEQEPPWLAREEKTKAQSVFRSGLEKWAQQRQERNQGKEPITPPNYEWARKLEAAPEPKPKAAANETTQAKDIAKEEPANARETEPKPEQGKAKEQRNSKESRGQEHNPEITAPEPKPEDKNKDLAHLPPSIRALVEQNRRDVERGVGQDQDQGQGQDR